MADNRPPKMEEGSEGKPKTLTGRFDDFKDDQLENGETKVTVAREQAWKLDEDIPLAPSSMPEVTLWDVEKKCALEGGDHKATSSMAASFGGTKSENYFNLSNRDGTQEDTERK